MSSLYSLYLSEKEGKETLEYPDHGFVTYKVVGKTCHICVIYVKPEVRDGKVARDLMKAVIQKVSDRCTALTAACFTKQANTTGTLKILLQYGFEVVGTDNHDILLYKEL